MTTTYAGFYGTNTALAKTAGSAVPKFAGLEQIFVLDDDGITISDLYTDALRTGVAANPITTGDDGEFSFYAEPGLHYLLGPDGEKDPVFVQPWDLEAASIYVAKNAWKIDLVRDYGVGSDLAVDSSALVQQAYDDLRALGGGQIQYPPWPILAGDLVASGNVEHIGIPEASELRFAAGAQYLLSVNPGTAGTTNPDDNETGVVMHGLTLRGRVVEDGFAQHKHLLNLNAVTDIDLSDMMIIGFQGDGIYLGSGNVAGLERHNRRVNVEGVVFDGLNNDNRNGISIIDCDEIDIVRCEFYRTTRANMPGAIDFEPNPGAPWAILRKANVERCWFRQIGGNVGSIGLVAQNAQADLVTPFTDFSFTRNDLDEPLTLVAAFVIAQPAGAGVDETTVAIDAVIERNRIANYRRPYEVEGVRGVEYARNRQRLMKEPGLLGFSVAQRVRDFRDHDNTYDTCGWGNGFVHQLTNADYVDYRRNTYINCGRADGLFGGPLDLGSNGTSSFVAFEENVVRGPRSRIIVQQESTHTTQGDTNSYLNNVVDTASGARDLMSLSTTRAFTLPGFLIVHGDIAYDLVNDRLSLGKMAALPSNATGAYVGWADGIAGASFGDLVLVPRTNLAGKVRFYTGTPDPVERLVVSAISQFSGQLNVDGLFVVRTADHLSNLFQVDTSGNLFLGSLKASGVGDLPRLFGGGTSKGMIIYGSPAGAGTSGIIRLRDNPADETQRLSFDTATGKILGVGDIEITDPARGVILHSPDNTKYRITVADDGALTTTVVA